MHALIEAATDEKPALQPNAAIGPALRAIAANILAKARVALTDPELTNQTAVHDFRRAMKQWRALMRLLEPFIVNADSWRREARDHARSLAHARDGAAALNAFDGLGDEGHPAALRALQRDRAHPHRSASRQRGAGSAHAGAARHHSRLARCRHRRPRIVA